MCLYLSIFEIFASELVDKLSSNIPKHTCETQKPDKTPYYLTNFFAQIKIDIFDGFYS